MLVDALTDLTRAARELPEPPAIDLPSPGDLELDTVMLPREAFFARTEDVPAKEAVDLDMLWTWLRSSSSLLPEG